MLCAVIAVFVELCVIAFFEKKTNERALRVGQLPNC